MTTTKKGLLERMADGVVVGDGSFVCTLEKRGYVMAGTWTPEATVQYPDAVKQLHREYLRAGADVMQTFTFYASEDSMNFKSSDGNKIDVEGTMMTWGEVNRKACDLAREVADEGDALVAGGLSPIPAFGKESKEYIQNEFRKQCHIFVEKKVDFLLGEFFQHVIEAEWAIEVMAETGLPVACSMTIMSKGDKDGVLPGEVAVRMAKAGADVIGINCFYDYKTSLQTIQMMRKGLEAAGLSRPMMLQPLGYHCQEIATDPRGYIILPEFPLAMETRLLNRVDAHKFAREAYEMGVRYIGGCCGFEPYHIRAIAEELSNERGRRPPGEDKHDGYDALKRSVFVTQHERANAEYWNKLVPAAGRENVLKCCSVAPPLNSTNGH